MKRAVSTSMQRIIIDVFIVSSTGAMALTLLELLRPGLVSSVINILWVWVLATATACVITFAKELSLPFDGFERQYLRVILAFIIGLLLAYISLLF